MTDPEVHGGPVWAPTLPYLRTAPRSYQLDALGKGVINRLRDWRLSVLRTGLYTLVKDA